MITLNTPADINWDNVIDVAYHGITVSISPTLCDKIERGRAALNTLIESGIPCYGVTTGLGQLVTESLDESAKHDLPRNILRARAAGMGAPLPTPVVRSTMLLRLVNFLSGADGVSSALCQFIIDRLNDDFIPWVPSLGHGMAGDAIAHTHCFQTLIGEGSIVSEHGRRIDAINALTSRGVTPYEPEMKEGLALISGIAAGPAIAIHAYRTVRRLLDVANLAACTSFEALAAPKDSIDPGLLAIAGEPGVAEILRIANQYLQNSTVKAFKLQACVSARIFPQVHGALYDALVDLKSRIESTFTTFSDNPYMIIGDQGSTGRFLSNGNFHNQHLVNQIESVALNIAHLGILSERRLHRLLDPKQTGLNPQLAPIPGLDAGLVVAHKACIDFTARLKVLAQPVSLFTAETSGGQEDYMSNIFPAALRLFDMCELAHNVLAYELLSALVALDERGQTPGDAIEWVRQTLRARVPALKRDRSPGPDAETIAELIEHGALDPIISQYGL